MPVSVADASDSVSSTWGWGARRARAVGPPPQARGWGAAPRSRQPAARAHTPAAAAQGPVHPAPCAGRRGRCAAGGSGRCSPRQASPPRRAAQPPGRTCSSSASSAMLLAAARRAEVMEACSDLTCAQGGVAHARPRQGSRRPAGGARALLAAAPPAPCHAPGSRAHRGVARAFPRRPAPARDAGAHLHRQRVALADQLLRVHAHFLAERAAAAGTGRRGSRAAGGVGVGGAAAAARRCAGARRGADGGGGGAHAGGGAEPLLRPHARQAASAPTMAWPGEQRARFARHPRRISPAHHLCSSSSASRIDMALQPAVNAPRAAAGWRGRCGRGEMGRLIERGKRQSGRGVAVCYAEVAAAAGGEERACRRAAAAPFPARSARARPPGAPAAQPDTSCPLRP
jgi:hypothetical protein